MENKIETTNLALLLRLSDLLKEHYKSQDPKDVEVSFEFIIGSLFPKAWHNVQEALIDEHTKGYIEGLQSKYKDFSTCKMSGNIEVIKRINDFIKTEKENINYMSYDAGYFGWEGEALRNENNIRDNFYKWCIEGETLCNQAIGEYNETKKLS